MTTQSPAIEPAVRLQTRFGEFEAPASSVVSFPAGLPGFERSRAFVVLAASDGASLRCLHAVSGPAASFLALDPRTVLPEYRCELRPEDLRRLDANPGDDLLWLAILTVAEEGPAFANLRAPVVINPRTMTGFQVVPRDAVYPLRHPVALG